MIRYRFYAWDFGTKVLKLSNVLDEGQPKEMFFLLVGVALFAEFMTSRVTPVIYLNPAENNEASRIFAEWFLYDSLVSDVNNEQHDRIHSYAMPRSAQIPQCCFWHGDGSQQHVQTGVEGQLQEWCWDLDPQKSWSTTALAMISVKATHGSLMKPGIRGIRSPVTLHSFFAKAAGVQLVEEPVPPVPKSERPVPKSEQPMPKPALPPLPPMSKPPAPAPVPAPVPPKPDGKPPPPVPKPFAPPKPAPPVPIVIKTWRTQLSSVTWRTHRFESLRKMAGLCSPPWARRGAAFRNSLCWLNLQKVGWLQILLLQGMNLCFPGRSTPRAWFLLRERFRALPAWSRTRSSSQFTYMRHFQKVSRPRSWSHEQVPGQHSWIST